jgi:heptosyltransferase III
VTFEEHAPRSRLLVLRGGALGDLVLTLPVLRALRCAYPDSKLSLLGNPPQISLAENRHLADEAYDLGSQSLVPLFVKGSTFSQEWINRLRQTDLAISYLADPEGSVRHQLLSAGVKRLVTGPHEFLDQGKHAVDHLAAPLTVLGVRFADRVPRLFLKASRHLEPTLALHPGSGSTKKNWPITSWLRLLKAIDDLWSRIYLVIGEADLAVYGSLQAKLLSSKIYVLRLVGLRELANRLAKSHLFVGHDSGVTHLAAALGVPTIALFGPTDPAIWRPLGAHVKVLQSTTGRMEDLAVEELVAAVRQKGDAGAQAGETRVV